MSHDSEQGVNGSLVTGTGEQDCAGGDDAMTPQYRGEYAQCPATLLHCNMTVQSDLGGHIGISALKRANRRQDCAPPFVDRLGIAVAPCS